MFSRSLFTTLRIISCHLISYHRGSHLHQFSPHNHFTFSSDIIGSHCPAPEPLRGHCDFVGAFAGASQSAMQYPWPYPYWPQQPPTHTIPIHLTHAATPHLQPHMMPTITHMPQPTWQPTPLPQFQPPLQLTVPVPHPQAHPVPIPIPQQETLPSQPPTLIPQHQPPHPHPATQLQHPSSPTGQTAPPPWDYSQGVWQPFSIFPPVAHPNTGAQNQAQANYTTSPAAPEPATAANPSPSPHTATGDLQTSPSTALSPPANQPRLRPALIKTCGQAVPTISYRKPHTARTTETNRPIHLSTTATTATTAGCSSTTTTATTTSTSQAGEHGPPLSPNTSPPSHSGTAHQAPSHQTL